MNAAPSTRESRPLSSSAERSTQVDGRRRADRSSVAPFAATLAPPAAKAAGPAYGLWMGGLAAAAAVMVVVASLGSPGGAVVMAGSPGGASVPSEPAMVVAPSIPVTTESGTLQPVPPVAALSPDGDEMPGAVEFDEDMARTALSLRGKSAAACKAPRGAAHRARVVVTFSPIGRSTGARFEGASLQNSPAAECIRARFEGVSIPAFRGADRSVTTTITLR